MSNEITIHDAYKVFPAVSALQFVKKFIDAAPERTHAFYYDFDQNCVCFKKICLIYSAENINKFIKYLTRTTGHMYIKMLMTMDGGKTSDYESMHAQVLKPRGIRFGNDTLLWHSLQKSGLIELDHLGKYRRKFFRLTVLGQLVVDAAKKNDVAYKVLRHFMKFKDTLDDATMMTLMLNPETFNDMTPASYVSMLEAILDTSSVLHEIGSYAYWMNKLVEALKKSEVFFNEFNCSEVNAWLESHLDNENVQRFNKIFQKTMKKHVKENSLMHR